MPKAYRLRPPFEAADNHVTPNALGCLIHENNVVISVDDHHTYRQRCKDQANEILILVDFLLCVFPFGDVLYRAKHPKGSSKLVTHDFIPNVHKTNFTVRADDAVFHIVNLSSLECFAEGLLLDMAI